MKDIANEEGKSTKTETAEEPRDGRMERAKAFVKRHGLEIVLGISCVGLGAVCVRQGNALAIKDKIIKLQGVRIRDLVALCEEKDSWFKELMSDALRRGSSLAGKCMVDRREVLLGR